MLSQLRRLLNGPRAGAGGPSNGRGATAPLVGVSVPRPRVYRVVGKDGRVYTAVTILGFQGDVVIFVDPTGRVQMVRGRIDGAA